MKNTSNSSKDRAILKKLGRSGDLLRKLEAISGKPIESTAAYKQGVVYLVGDCSSSMEGFKLNHAKSGSVGFAQEAFNKGYSVGLIKFASNAEHLMEPTSEIRILKEKVELFYASGWTNMTEAIDLAKRKLTDNLGDRIIYIVTDGMPNEPESAIEVAEEAKRNGIDIMTLGTDDADRTFLERLASRKELAKKVEKQQLKESITSMARMLPEGKK